MEMLDEDREGRDGTTQRGAGVKEEIDEEGNQIAGIVPATRRRREDLRVGQFFFNDPLES